MKYPPDDFSTHPYEVKNVYTEGTSFKTLVFYLRHGEPMNIQIDQVLKKTNLWVEPTQSEPKREYQLFLEVSPQHETGIVDVHMVKFIVELGEDASC